MKKLVIVLVIALVVFSLVACGGADVEETAAVSDSFTGISESYGGDLEVEVVITDGEIAEINILEINDTEGISDPAQEEVPEAIIAAQSTDVDVASGATLTSEAIIDAVDQALAEAGL